MTNQERLKYLKDRIKELTAEVRANNLESSYCDLLESIKTSRITPIIITDDEWEIIPPNDKKGHLLTYYHCLRTELHTLLQTPKHETAAEQLDAWLSSPYVKIAVTAGGILTFTLEIADKLHSLGLFYMDESPPDWQLAKHLTLGPNC